MSQHEMLRFLAAVDGVLRDPTLTTAQRVEAVKALVGRCLCD